MVSVQRL
jgi:ATP-binding cassette, subfamily C (CFTR/MRP), member 1